MSSSTLKKISIYTAGALSGLALSIGLQSIAADTPAPKEKAQGLPIKSLESMAQVYAQIKANYVRDEPDEKLLENAMKGMVSGLDPHSEYLDKKAYESMKEATTGEFGGLGMEIGAEDGFVKVIAPIEDTPAERAGVKSGDYIVKINSESTRGLSVNEAVKKMRGKPNTKITLTLSRKGASKPIEVQLTRAIIKVKSVRAHLLDGGYGYIRVTQFQAPTVDNVVQAVNDLTKENGGALKGIVLDLRDDPGGLLNGAVGVSSVFLPKDNVIVRTKGRGDKIISALKNTPEDYIVKSGTDPLSKLPSEIKTVLVTVLINSGSASASEIVAGALQDHKRAVIVGTRSYGKGSVQTLIPISKETAVKFTTALYYTPNDRSIQAVGIVPDVEVVDKTRTFESREADLDGHIGNPLGADDVKGGVVKQASEPVQTASEVKVEAASEPSLEELSSRRKPNPEKDEQLRKALDLLKNPTQWQQSLGEAAKKEAAAKAKTAKKK
ncbi:S41 family peptidase [Kingella negevensis]|uniref:Putative CtpA-like serine protease n=1 Tax=Kingella negevensis TaxID=1522312 RepID=A0A238TBG9_9NEIS|nr:S41 family peptidase [Kingella negevensis]MDK4696796.1 S41 family peptidase [Kingella negevensis]MDK4707981.1 S41 family peptidase [Kingella negevensis]MDK4709499.1 S41 family peptidase [Kingella negevensis]SNB73432.1 putative CtpA-like serine protease [Kingella negevensis]